MTRRRHDDFTVTPAAAAGHADLFHSYQPDPPETVSVADVEPMGPQPTCVCGGMVVFSIRPGVWSECWDCGRPSRMTSDVRGERGAA